MAKSVKLCFLAAIIALVAQQILAGGDRDGDCIPHISMYTDCTEANKCTGCSKCECTAEGRWRCNTVHECGLRSGVQVNQHSVNSAFNTLLTDVLSKARQVNDRHVDAPKEQPTAHIKASNIKAKGQERRYNDDQLLETEDIESEILRLMKREKRGIKNRLKANKESRRKLNATDEMENNSTVKFYNTVDEINEDTLRNSSASGTIPAAKVDMTLTSLDTNTLQKTNPISHNPLHIEYSNPHQHIDKKIDETNNDTASIDIVEQRRLGIISNHTQQEKDTDLSKIVVNELKKGSEVIGDKEGPVMSNITFTPENDTLTAMAFIAGNLLNKLWSMEKDSDEVSMEIEMLKNEKLQDLLDLFKEPLTMRQEAFLRNALDALSRAIDRNKNANITFCESISDAKKFLEESKNRSWEKSDFEFPKGFLPSVNGGEEQKNKNDKNSDKETETKGTINAIEKLNNVLNLMKKYESVHKRINSLNQDSKPADKEKYLHYVGSKVNDDDKSLNTFGNILDKVTRLLLPNKASKKIGNKIRSLNVFSSKDKEIKEKLKDRFKIDMGNSTISAKDKNILDYLTKIKNSPSTLIDEITSDEAPSTNVEGDILKNLSQFFKIKSLIELMKLVEEKTERPVQNQDASADSATEMTTLSNLFLTTTTEIVMTKLERNLKSDVANLKSSPESPKIDPKHKLKLHLKTILDDLAELQREKGINSKDSDLKIADVFPCIYNVLKPENELQRHTDIHNRVNPVATVSNIFEEIKNGFNSTDFRRMGNDDELSGRRATKSAFVWDRVLSNMAESQSKTRRNFDSKVPLSYEEIQKKIENVAISDPEEKSLVRKASETAPADQMMAYKSVLTEIKRHLEVLKDIQTAYDTIDTLSQKRDIIEYVSNASVLVNTDRNLMQSLELARSNHKAKDVPKNPAPVPEVKKKENLKMEVENTDKNMKLTRNEILKQLIKNRVTAYIKIKMAGPNPERDSNYLLARNILMNLDKENFLLAKQLYKIFVSNKEQQNSVNDGSDLNPKFVGSKLLEAYNDKGTHSMKTSILDKEPLIQFEEPNVYSNQLQISRRNQMLKSLLDSKSIRGIK